ncbi:MAG: glycosyltransferase family 4 protein [Verrucomicrobiota bacterium]|jgi:glycosyltransferase involved in cell wall biosynthesis
MSISLCIVSHNAYGAISGSLTGHIGGVEWQTSMLAKWLADKGYRATLLTWDEGGPPEEMIQGVRVIKLCKHNAGLTGLRFFHPKWSSLLRAMRQANADLYYQNGSECTTGQVALWCQRHHKPFVFTLASDADCNPALPELSKHERMLYRLGLKMADRRVAQTLTQANRLRDVFAASSVVIPMPCPEPPAKHLQPPLVGARRVLWIGRICPVKRPDRLLDLAALCPELAFDLVGPFLEEQSSNDVRARAKKMSNLTLHGGMPRERVHEFYDCASLLCCTSEYEGFPNTFLEAWSHGLPVVSTFDPDGVIAKHNLGIVARDIPEMRSAIYSLLGSPARFQECSRNARRYFIENHQAETVLPRFESLFLDTLRQCNNGKREVH